MTQPLNGSMQLPDGRLLGFAEYGVPDGRPLLYFHGHPGARFESRFLADAALRANVRLIGVDRPGMGLSTYQAGRRVQDWPGDVCALADHLGLDRFAVVGFSGGGPYALACAYAIPNRLVSCGIVSSVGQIGLMRSFLAAWVPWLILPLLRQRFFPSEDQARQTLTRVANRWPQPDRIALDVAGVKDLMAASLVEGFTKGARGAAYDGALLGRAWGFRPEELDFRAVYLWHGVLDTQIPVEDARALARCMHLANAVFYPSDAHISTIVNHSDDIIASLVG